MENEEKTYLSKNEVIEFLGIVEATFYKLVQNGQLEAEILPENIKRKKRYSKDSVLRYQQQYQPDIPGLKVAEFAKKHKLTNQRVYAYIKKLDFTLPTVQIGKRKVLYLTSEQQEVLIKEIYKHKHRGAKSDFFNSKSEVALYQKFINEAGESYRVVNENGEWGFYITNQFIDVEQAKKELLLEPSYSIHKKPIYSSSYAEFIIPAVKSYAFLDLFYNALGIENIYIFHNPSENVIELSLKAISTDVADIIHISNDSIQSILNSLNQYSINGSVTLVDGILNITANTKSITFEVNETVYELIEAMALRNGTSISKEVTKIVATSEYIQNNSVTP